MKESIAFEEHMGLLRNICSRFSRHPAITRDAAIDIDDLFQEASFAFIKAFRKGWVEDKAAFTTYITDAVTNHLLNYTRNLCRKKRSYLQEEQPATTVTTDYLYSDLLAPDILSLYEFRSSLLASLESVLSVQEYTTVAMYYGLLDGEPLTESETSKILGISQQGVNSRLRSIMSRTDVQDIIKDNIEDIPRD